MDGEERPAKLQKREHTVDTSDAQFSHPTTANGKSSEDQSSPVEEPDHQEDGNRSVSNCPEETTTPDETTPKMSKNQLKKLRRQQLWDAGAEARKEKRKQKAKEKKERKREAFKQRIAGNEGGSDIPVDLSTSAKKKTSGVQVPVTVIFDCDFDDLMFDQEIKSLGTQITRCYSDNRNAAFKTHLAIASFGGKLKERFEGTLSGQYKSWHNVEFSEADFVKVAEQSKERMTGPKGGKLAGALAEHDDNAAEKEGEIVYLSSESDNTLEVLKPNSTYIIGGLVDKNRYKGLCYKRAMDRGIKTAKLPIGEFLQMNSRQVLATNHVLEIMLKWLECGDWGEAFMEVIPKRKGGMLKGVSEEKEEPDEEGAGADQGHQAETSSTEKRQPESENGTGAGEGSLHQTSSSEGDANPVASDSDPTVESSAIAEKDPGV